MSRRGGRVGWRGRGRMGGGGGEMGGREGEGGWGEMLGIEES